jgi:hypothetical protein
MMRNVLWAKYGYLQVFCNLQKLLANYRAAFTRQRTLVRTQHRPLSKSGSLQDELGLVGTLAAYVGPLLHQ